MFNIEGVCFFIIDYVYSYFMPSGKCYICMILGFLRCKFKDDTRRSLVNELHRLHRATYMSERFHYYKRAEKAVFYPDDYYSDISDGMASDKTVVPRDKDCFEFKPSLSMHVQGKLAHGRSLDLYRTFNNLSVGSNVSIHCWLLSLEDEYKYNMERSNNQRGLPDTIFHQIDGGSENVAKAAMAIAELLVAKRLTRKVVISRLPVGHTHEVPTTMY